MSVGNTMRYDLADGLLGHASQASANDPKAVV